MKSNIYKKSKGLTAGLFVLTSILISSKLQSQTFTETFESFTLAPNSAYSSTVNAPFVSNQASFSHKTSSPYWIGGFAYTNIHDSIQGDFSHLYGVRAFKGNANSEIYVAGQDGGVVKMVVPQTTVSGFYITNTTYAYKSILKGDQFARKFGDTTGTHSGTTIAQGSYPDFFKVVVKGYSNGTLKTDSITFMLADYTFTNNAQDYVLNTWQFVNTSSIGAVDSIKFFLRSSDNGSFGMNTPGFFAIDDFSTVVPNPTGLGEVNTNLESLVYPNPFSDRLVVKTKAANTNVNVSDLFGRVVYQTEMNYETELDLSFLQKGIYLLDLNSNGERSTKRIIKN